MGDILAHVVYFALGVNLTSSALKDRDISLRSVITRVSCLPTPVNSTLQEIELSPDFMYLAALVNHSKHRSVIDRILSVDRPAERQPPCKLLFDAFSYGDKQHPQGEIGPYLERVYAWLSHKVVQCGIELNAAILQP